jgi:hypothetical protein
LRDSPVKADDLQWMEQGRKEERGTEKKEIKKETKKPKNKETKKKK